LFGDIDGHESELACFEKEFAGDGEVFRFDFGTAGQDGLLGEFCRGASDFLLLFGEVLGGENVFGGGVFDEEGAAGDDFG
jgi:hypothetical protein